MIEEFPGNPVGGTHQPERNEQSLENRRAIIVGELRAIMHENFRLVADKNASLDRLFEINGRERSLIDQLGEIERAIVAARGKK